MKQELSEEEKEMSAKLAQAKTVEDVLAVAKEYGKDINEEQAKEVLEELNKFSASGELSDDELDNVAGGVAFDPNDPEWLAEWARVCQQLARLHMGG